MISSIHKFEDKVARILLGLIIMLVFLAATCRWIGYPIVWSVDIAQLLFGWVVFFGADMALRNNSHIGIDMLINHLPQKIRRGIILFHYFLICAFLCLIAVYGFYLSFMNYQRTFNSITLSYSYATVSVPIGCVLMLISMVSKINSLLRKPR